MLWIHILLILRHLDSHVFDTLINFKDIIDLEKRDKKKFLRNYYLFKVSNKFGLTIYELYDKLNTILS